MNLIEKLKNNTSAFGLMAPELREVAEKIGNIREFIIFEGISGPGWSQPSLEKFCTGAVYRLRADFKCQHPEKEASPKWCDDHPHTSGPTGFCGKQLKYYPDGISSASEKCPYCGEIPSVCSWCGEEIKPEPKMGWVGAEVREGPLFYEAYIQGSGWFSLSSARDRCGFGGVKYEAPCDCMGDDKDFYMREPEPCEQHGPYRPVAVRFWREK